MVAASDIILFLGNNEGHSTVPPLSTARANTSLFDRKKKGEFPVKIIDQFKVLSYALIKPGEYRKP